VVLRSGVVPLTLIFPSAGMSSLSVLTFLEASDFFPVESNGVEIAGAMTVSLLKRDNGCSSMCCPTVFC
jgi:hypothetical protein